MDGEAWIAKPAGPMSLSTADVKTVRLLQPVLWLRRCWGCSGGTGAAAAVLMQTDNPAECACTIRSSPAVGRAVAHAFPACKCERDPTLQKSEKTRTMNSHDLHDMAKQAVLLIGRTTL